jgi:type II secretory pathway pseudopilin PulG
MMTMLQVAGCRLQVGRRPQAECATGGLQPSAFSPRSAFSLVEILVVVSLLSLIVLALMAVFNSTQRAFRASVTQTDVLEGGRAAVDLIVQDLRQLTPSGGTTNYTDGGGNYHAGAVNFFSLDNSYSPALNYSPLVQSLPGSGASRVNFLNYFFLLGRENNKWIGIGYAVNVTNSSPLYPLYRFYAETNLATPPLALFNKFLFQVNNGQWTNLSHVVDGVVHLVVRAGDVSGYAMTNTYQFNAGQWVTNKNVLFYPPVQAQGEVGFYFYSNTVPASVELQVGLLEDRPLQRAESLPFNSPAQISYLQQQAGHVHVFRQQVTIPNLDPTAYQ